MDQVTAPAGYTRTERLPLGGLLALSMVAFITLLTEIIPAGLLSAIAQGLQVTESLAGQFITAFAIGALLAAIPVMLLTQGIRRRPLLLFALFGFALVNVITAISNSYLISMGARFFAGVFGGIVWSMLVGYSVRMSPPHLNGRAIAIISGSVLFAMVLGVPLGTLLGKLIGWQGVFAMIAIGALLLIPWIITIVPDFPGRPKEHRQPFASVLVRRGIRSVLLITFTFVVSYNILYTYIEPFLSASNLSASVANVLLVFGLGVAVSLCFVGVLVDRWLNILTVVLILLFICAALLLAFWSAQPVMVYLSMLIWGLAFGGFATVTQTALSRFAEDSVDIAQSIYTTTWNSALAVGGIAGGLLLDLAGAASFARVILLILLVSLLTAVFAMNRAAGR